MSGVAIGIVHDAHMDSLFVRDFARLLRERDRSLSGVIFVQGGAGRLDNARNEVARRFLLTKSEWLLTVDTDMTFTPEDFDLLRETPGSVKSGVYFVDERPPRPAMGDVVDGIIHSPQDWDDGLINPAYVGAGFMLIHRKVLEALGSQPYRQDVLAPNGDLVGEDYAFCQRVRDHGFEITVNTKVFLGHVKSRVLGVDL